MKPSQEQLSEDHLKIFNDLSIALERIPTNIVPDEPLQWAHHETMSVAVTKYGHILASTRNERQRYDALFPTVRTFVNMYTEPRVLAFSTDNGPVPVTFFCNSWEAVREVLFRHGGGRIPREDICWTSWRDYIVGLRSSWKIAVAPFLVAAQKGKCWYCGARLLTGPTYGRSGLKKVDNAFARPNSMAIDHQVPISRGGSDDLHNLVACCRRCNNQKGGKTVEEYRSFMVRGALCRFADAENLIATMGCQYQFWAERQFDEGRWHAATANQQTERATKG